MLGRVERAAQRLEALDHLDLERTDRRVHPVEAELARRPHDAVLVAAAHEREGVGDAEVRVLALPDDEEQLVGARVAVEVVAVVEVAIAGAGLADRLGDLVDREVVEGREHRGLLVSRARRASSASRRVPVWSKAPSAAPGNTPVESRSFITRTMIEA